MPDLCDYCEGSLLLKEDIDRKITESSGEILINTDNENRIAYYTQKMIELRKTLQTTNNPLLKETIETDLKKYIEIHSMLKDYEAILFHKNISDCQTMAFNNSRKSVEFLRNRILIEIDFKVKFAAGLSQTQVGGETLNQTHRSCLGLF